MIVKKFGGSISGWRALVTLSEIQDELLELLVRCQGRAFKVRRLATKRRRMIARSRISQSSSQTAERAFT